jgi:hypothetical protein
VAGSCEDGNEPSGSIKMLGNFSVAERLAASQEGLRSMELVSYSCVSYCIILKGKYTVRFKPYMK